MIVTIKNNTTGKSARFCLYHVVGVSEDDNHVSLIDGTKIQLDAAQMAALITFWDSQAEIIATTRPAEGELPQPTARDDREFPLGHEDAPPTTSVD